ncbi:hypothetical protein J2X85_000008 [Microbacterium trichothecenolyticum]|uniref:immunoglobulin domain-containing protein n=1 Tax=Microbacterium trichothecenolyticum TaxID=69370 RepID=UPI00285C928B|nr:immunoglobulin domain-containing protein [Microbacterium trichothecenolyticum]MDR7182985.1 hypothetical protein [Microbacterium trichothecenolyticum]
MSISKKWSAAAAGLLSIVLVGGGVASANAAPGDPIKNPQSNGSEGSFYLFDENAELSETPGKVFDRFQYVFAASDNVDYLSEIDPDDYAAAGTWDTVYKFIAKPSELNGGTGSWRAYALDAAAGPNGGVLTPALTLGDLTGGNNGGIDSVFAADGDWLVGLAFTTNAGVTPVGLVYRTVTIDGDTDTYTYAPIEYEDVVEDVAPAVTTQPTSASVTEGADATFTAAASGTPAPSVKWQSSTNGTDWSDVSGATSASLTVPAVTLAQSGAQYRAVFTNAAGSATTNSVQLTVSAAIVEPTAATHAATQKTFEAPVNGVLTIDAGAANANQQFKAIAWSAQTDLGTVTTNAAGVASITVPAALQDGAAHTFALLQANNQVVAWTNGVIAAPEFPLTDTTALTASVTNSGKFALEGVNAAVNLTPIEAVKRGATTTPVPLGAFTVTDDRDNLVGWNLNATVTEFKTAAGDIIPNTALGLAPKKVGEAVEGITARATPKAAGDEWTSTLVAEGAANSNTVEAGTQFDADLTFKAPAKAKKGTYTSTLTLTLSSK